ncbi:hypothetical protein EVA24_04595 [bacterium]|nr:MAG: hypothetical protein EVA24_04595 [bacterium]
MKVQLSVQEKFAFLAFLVSLILTQAMFIKEIQI